jgi:hypothetical protein
MKNRVLGTILGAVLATMVVATLGCGGSPPDTSAEHAESALTSTQIYWSPSSTTPGGPFTGASYACAGATYYWRQPILQYRNSRGNLITQFTNDFPVSINSARNEVQLLCGGMIMTDDGANLENLTATTCDVISHLVGQTSWSYSVRGVSMIANTTYYYPKSWSFPNGRWEVYLIFPRTDGAGLAQWGTGYGTGCFSYPGPGVGTTQQNIY